VASDCACSSDISIQKSTQCDESMLSPFLASSMMTTAMMTIMMMMRRREAGGGSVVRAESKQVAQTPAAGTGGCRLRQ